MAGKQAKSAFNTDKRIKLGIWGLGRGRHFYGIFKHLNIDVVAGCDYFEPLRENFLAANPGAFATASSAEFLERDFDAVLLATFCPAHADDAIACLNAGKHVLSEVTSFHTMAEGVRLVEAVEKSGLIYNLAENYPFTALNMWLKRRWDEGLFGELQYAEFEYLHDCVSLCYSYFGGKPLPPGNQTHNWRSWINEHFYCTHSLCPIMYITGLRPTRVAALPSQKVNLVGTPLDGGLGVVCPELISMSNGSVVRNLMGGTTNDSHTARLWGTRGAAQLTPHGGAELRLGGRGQSPIMKVTPRWDGLGKFAAETGHDGGDFWPLYHFARQILFGDPAPFDIYSGADCTIAGILAYRSAMENGKAYDIPNFRNKAERDPYRDDNSAQKRYNTKTGLFGDRSGDPLTLTFTRTVTALLDNTAAYQAFQDWNRVRGDMHNPMELIKVADAAIHALPALQAARRDAREMITRFPGTDAARILNGILGMIDPDADRNDAGKTLKARRREIVNMAPMLAKSGNTDAIVLTSVKALGAWRASPLIQGKGRLEDVHCARLSRKIAWQDMGMTPYHFPDGASGWKVIVHDLFKEQDGIVYIGNRFEIKRAGPWSLCIGHDGGIKLFVDGKALLCEPRRRNPLSPDRTIATANLSRGAHEIVIALDTDHGFGWGIILRFAPGADIVRALKSGQ